MHGYSEAVKADVRRRMSPPHRQGVSRISEELGMHLSPSTNGGQLGGCSRAALKSVHVALGGPVSIVLGRRA